MWLVEVLECGMGSTPVSEPAGSSCDCTGQPMDYSVQGTPRASGYREVKE